MGLWKEPYKDSGNNAYHKEQKKKSAYEITIPIPAFLRSAFGSPKNLLSVDELHESVAQIIESLAKLQETDSIAEPTRGIALAMKYCDVQKVNDDFICDIRIAINNNNVFSGRLRILGAFKRDKLIFAHSVVAAIETLLMQIYQVSAIGDSDVHVAMGVIELDGQINNQSILQESLSKLYESFSTRPSPGFDSNLPFGIWPALGYRYYYGVCYDYIGGQTLIASVGNPLDIDLK